MQHWIAEVDKTAAASSGLRTSPKARLWKDQLFRPAFTFSASFMWRRKASLPSIHRLIRLRRSECIQAIIEQVLP
jgi:hypothetical protein